MDSVRLTCHIDRTELVLEGVLDASRVRNAYQPLDQTLGRGLPIELQAAGLERVDTAGLQLLLMFCRSARGRGLKTEWRSVSAALRSAGAQLGIVTELELPA